jgi:hypothetical protein
VPRGCASHQRWARRAAAQVKLGADSNASGDLDEDESLDLDEYIVEQKAKIAPQGAPPQRWRASKHDWSCGAGWMLTDCSTK